MFQFCSPLVARHLELLKNLFLAFQIIGRNIHQERLRDGNPCCKFVRLEEHEMPAWNENVFNLFQCLAEIHSVVQNVSAKDYIK